MTSGISPSLPPSNYEFSFKIPPKTTDKPIILWHWGHSNISLPEETSRKPHKPIWHWGLQRKHQGNLISLYGTGATPISVYLFNIIQRKHQGNLISLYGTGATPTSVYLYNNYTEETSMDPEVSFMFPLYNA